MTDRERVELLRAALADLRTRLSTLPDRRQVDEVLRLTEVSPLRVSAR